MRPFAKLPFVLLIVISGMADADIYKCPGPNGTIQYSQIRISASCTELNQAPQPAHTGSDTSSVDRYLHQVDKAQVARDKQQAETDQDAQLRQQACSLARSRATLLNQPGRAFVTDQNGDRSYLSDPQYDQQRQQVNDAVEQFCQ